jgi:hypothetical protein
VAKEEVFTESKAAAGKCDMTLYQIIDVLIH